MQTKMKVKTSRRVIIKRLITKAIKLLDRYNMTDVERMAMFHLEKAMAYLEK